MNEMNTKSVLSVCGIALLIAGGVTVPDVMAREVKSPSSTAVRSHFAGQVILPGSLGFGVAADVYLDTCFAKSISADVRDAGPFNDTNFQVALIGSGGGIEGQSSVRISPQGGLSGLASVSRFSGDGSLRAYKIITEVNALGSENYDTLQFCTQANGTVVDPTVVQILDQ
jgi:hypothetical protein